MGNGDSIFSPFPIPHSPFPIPHSPLPILLRRDRLANRLRPDALVAVSVNGGDLIEIFLAHLHFIIAERRGLVQFRIELDPFFGRVVLVLGAVNVITDYVRLGAEGPEEADYAVDRSDGD